MTTREEVNAKLREYRRSNSNAVTKKYEKSKPGFLMRLYRNMQSRISGVQAQKYHLYVGKYLLPRQDFYQWANESKEFHELFSEWEASGYNRKLTPSVDRINSSEGYALDNMEWVTHSVNSSRATRKRFGLT